MALSDGSTLAYDVLLVATGSVLQPEETEGLAGAGWLDTVFTFYDMEGASALATKTRVLRRRPLVINVVDMPIKCPVAPLEFAFLADWYFTERASATTSRSPMSRRSTALHQADRIGDALVAARREEHRARHRVQHRRGRRRRPEAHRLRRDRDPLRPGRGRSPCTAAPPTSRTHPASATSSGSSRPTTQRCSPP